MGTTPKPLFTTDLGSPYLSQGEQARKLSYSITFQKVEFGLSGLLKFEFQPIEPFVIMEGELKRQIYDEGCKLVIRLLKFWHWSSEAAQIGVPQILRLCISILTTEKLCCLTQKLYYLNSTINVKFNCS
jgi:hypothetical protein